MAGVTSLLPVRHMGGYGSSNGRNIISMTPVLLFEYIFAAVTGVGLGILAVLFVWSMFCGD